MTITDQLSNSLTLPGFPKRIISIVPSQTELLTDLGLNTEVIGITDYCVHPKDWHKCKTKIGGTKKLNLEKIIELQPDLIIANKEENEKSQVLELMKHFPVWMSDIKTLAEVLDMINSLGKITGKEKKATEIQNSICEQFSHFKLSTSSLRHPSSVLYLIWRKPYICVGSNTFIDHMLSICGLNNCYSAHERYPEITAEQIFKSNPDLIFLSSEPYPFREKHIRELQKICQGAKVVLVDGEMFSWYGSRLVYAPSYFERLLRNLY